MAYVGYSEDTARVALSRASIATAAVALARSGEVLEAVVYLLSSERLRDAIRLNPNRSPHVPARAPLMVIADMPADLLVFYAPLRMGPGEYEWESVGYLEPDFELSDVEALESTFELAYRATGRLSLVPPA